nr:hypothetical protein [Parapedobacter pyrenivorans]
MKEKEPFDFERFKQEAMEGLYAGKKAGGIDGVFAPLMKHLLESMLDGELLVQILQPKGSNSVSAGSKSLREIRGFGRFFRDVSTPANKMAGYGLFYEKLNEKLSFYLSLGPVSWLGNRCIFLCIEGFIQHRCCFSRHCVHYCHFQ